MIRICIDYINKRTSNPAIIGKGTHPADSATAHMCDNRYTSAGKWLFITSTPPLAAFPFMHVCFLPALTSMLALTLPGTISMASFWGVAFTPAHIYQLCSTHHSSFDTSTDEKSTLVLPRQNPRIASACGCNCKSVSSDNECLQQPLLTINTTSQNTHN